MKTIYRYTLQKKAEYYTNPEAIKNFKLARI